MEGQMMTENTPDKSSPEFTQEDVRAAELQEQAELNKAQMKHLQNRVVLLRVQLNRFKDEVDRLREEIARLNEAARPDVEISPEG